MTLLGGDKQGSGTTIHSGIWICPESKQLVQGTSGTEARGKDKRSLTLADSAPRCGYPGPNSQTSLAERIVRHHVVTHQQCCHCLASPMRAEQALAAAP